MAPIDFASVDAEKVRETVEQTSESIRFAINVATCKNEYSFNKKY